MVILDSRIYLGEVLLNGTWYPGRHEPILNEAGWAAAHRGFRRGKRRGRDLLSGRVRCGLCRRSMSIDHNGQGRVFFRCAHRGKGCAQPLRSTKGVLRAALLGLRLIASDAALQEAIRQQLAGARREARQGRRRAHPVADASGSLIERRRRLLELHYTGQISPELFAEEEGSLTAQIQLLRTEAAEEHESLAQDDELAERFDQVVSVLGELDLPTVWEAATEQERRVLIEELVDHVAVFPDHLEVAVHGAPRLNVLLSEVGLAESQNSGVGGPRLRFCIHRRTEDSGMWAQLITTRLKPDREDDLPGLVEQLRAVEQPGSGLVRSMAMQDQNDPSRVYMLVVFESEEKARARENDPRRQEGLQAARATMAEIFDGAPEFVDLTVVDEVSP